VIEKVAEPVSARLTLRIAGDARELSTLRHVISAWLAELGVDAIAGDRLIIAAHETAAEAIEHGASEVIVQGDHDADAVRLSVVGGDWSTIEDLRSRLIREVVPDVRVHRGVVGLRLELPRTTRPE
jgi:anti-sigma regulatory factor (Ser/Thr protein kinase)